MLRGLRRVLPITQGHAGTALTVRVQGRRMVTPLVVVIAAIGIANVVFALDSIPAIFGLTTDPYIVLTANAFALLGLRQLYFLIGGLLERIIYLNIGLSVILAFIGIKLLIEALHGSHVDALGADPAARDRDRRLARVHPDHAGGHHGGEPRQGPAGPAPEPVTPLSRPAAGRRRRPRAHPVGA